MKTKFITALFIFISLFSIAQTNANADEQAIRKSFVYFANTIKYKKLDQTVDCIYPKFFSTINKEQFTQMLNMTYNNPFVKIDVEDMKFISVGKPELIDGENFSITSYYLKLRADVSSMNDEMKKMVSDVLNKKYSKDKVQYLAKEDAYIINAPMKMVGVSKDKKNWKVVFADAEYKKGLEKVLPKKILDKL